MSRKGKTAFQLLLVLSLGLVCGCPFLPGRTTGGSADVGDPALGATLFADNGCSTCHGADGSGGIGPDIRIVGIARLDGQLRDPVSVHTGGLRTGLTDGDLANLAAFLGDGAGAGTGGGGTPPGDFHRFALGASGVLHGEGYGDPPTNCAVCHGADLSGTGAAPSCTSCHAPLWEGVNGPPITHTEPKGTGGVLHRPGFADPPANCSACHGANLEGSGSRPSCTSCHDQLWPGAGVPSNHVVSRGSPAAMHRGGLLQPETNCTACHGGDLKGVGSVPNCYTCHGPLWSGGGPPPTHTNVFVTGTGDVTGTHAQGYASPGTNCAQCHQSDLMGHYDVPACYSCHGQLWSRGGAPPSHAELLSNGAISGLHATGKTDPQANCASCHKSNLFGTSLVSACWNCHGSIWDGLPNYPPSHTKRKGSPQSGAYHDPGLKNPVGNCDACHGSGLEGTPLIPSCTLCHGSGEW